jgi:hypothetical protein
MSTVCLASVGLGARWVVSQLYLYSSKRRPQARAALGATMDTASGQYVDKGRAFLFLEMLVLSTAGMPVRCAHAFTGLLLV